MIFLILFYLTILPRPVALVRIIIGKVLCNRNFDNNIDTCVYMRVYQYIDSQLEWFITVNIHFNCFLLEFSLLLADCYDILHM